MKWQISVLCNIVFGAEFNVYTYYYVPKSNDCEFFQFFISSKVQVQNKYESSQVDVFVGNVKL